MADEKQTSGPIMTQTADGLDGIGGGERIDKSLRPVTQHAGNSTPSGGMPNAGTMRPGSHDSAIVVTQPVVRSDPRTINHEEEAAVTGPAPFGKKSLTKADLEPGKGDFHLGGKTTDGVAGSGKNNEPHVKDLDKWARIRQEARNPVEEILTREPRSHQEIGLFNDDEASELHDDPKGGRGK